MNRRLAHSSLTISLFTRWKTRETWLTIHQYLPSLLSPSSWFILSPTDWWWFFHEHQPKILPRKRESSLRQTIVTSFFPGVILILNCAVSWLLGCLSVCTTLTNINYSWRYLTWTHSRFMCFLLSRRRKTEAIAVKVLSLISSDIFVMMFSFFSSAVFEERWFKSFSGVLLVSSY